jgi:hypothetical protein
MQRRWAEEKRRALAANASDAQEKQAVADMSAAWARFKERAVAFSVEHRDEIKRSPEARRQFLSLCARIKVDPLASSGSMWRGVGLVQFYADLSVAAYAVCFASRRWNGGLISLRELTGRLQRQRGAGGAVSEEEVSRALAQLGELGGGYAEVTLGGAQYVRTVPEALDMDGGALVGWVGVRGACADDPEGSATVSGAVAGLRWEAARVHSALAALLREGLAWVDRGGGGAGERFYFPALLQLDSERGAPASGSSDGGGGGGRH